MAWMSEGWSNPGASQIITPTGGLITNFVPGPDTSGSCDIDGVFYQFLNGGRVSQVDNYTFQFESRQGERNSWDATDVDRVQVSGVFIDRGVLWDLNFIFRIETATINTAWWFVIAEMQDDPAITAAPPPWAIEINNGQKLGLVARWCPAGSNPSGGFSQQWVSNSSVDCAPNRDYNIRLRGRIDNTGAGGSLTMWIDGVQVGNYTGLLGYGNRNYFVFGNYRFSVPEIYITRFSHVSLDTAAV